MVDIVRVQGAGVPTSMVSRFVDLGDTSHAPIRATVLLGELADGSIVRLPFDFAFDSVSGHLEIIDAVHCKVHEGLFFESAYMSPHGAEIANDATFAMLLRNGASQNVHWVFEPNVGGVTELELVLNPTVTNQGTIVVPAPLNEVTTPVTTVTTTHTPTVTGGTGTERLHDLIAGGTGPLAGGEQIRSGVERVLGVNEDMLIRLTNRSGSAYLAGIHIQWYEVPA